MISLNVPSGAFEEAFALFAAVARSPAIGPSAITRAAGKAGPARTDLAGESGPALYEGSLAAAVDRFHDILYADHPYGARPQTEDFAALTVEDVRSFHAIHAVPSNIVISIAGDIDVSDVESGIVEHFGERPFVEAPEPGAAPPIGDLELAQHTFRSDKRESWLGFGHEL